MEPVVLFTTLGPNPAPLTELIWALARRQQRLVVEAHVVVTERGALYLQHELLPPDGPLDQLVALLGKQAAHGAALRIHQVSLPDGSPLVDDHDPAHADAYQQAVWAAARTAQETAGDRPLVFALASGRRRTMVAMVTMAYQMLARPQDVCLDVRVSDRRAEGGSGFFFPEQPDSLLVGPRGEFDASEVDVQLVAVSLPRLRQLLRDGDLTTAQGALAAAQQAVDRAAFPRLRVDLERGDCFVNGEPMGLGLSPFLWYSTLAIERRRGGDGWTPPDNPTLRKLLQAKPAPAWLEVEALPQHFRFARRGEPAELGKNDSLRVLRTKTLAVVKAFASQRFPTHGHLLVPAVQRRAKGAAEGLAHGQRLELPADCIEVHDPARLVTLPGSRVTLPRLSSPGLVAMLGVFPNQGPPAMTTIRTSVSHPIYVDWLPGIVEGRVGLTFAPGKHSTSKYVEGVQWRRDLAKDLDDLIALGATDLVCLLQDADLKKLKVPNLIEAAEARKLRVHRLPLVDQGTPTDRQALLALLAALQQRLAEGASVVIHCEGGKGRAGVVAGCLMVSLGASARGSLTRLHDARGDNCPENSRQRAFIESFATSARPWDGLALSEPRSLGALTLFMLSGRDGSLPPVISLGEALERGTACVREARDYQHVTLDNLGELPVLCLAGDLVKGGMQDRVLRHDLLLAPGQRGLVVAAFCVEQGRWGGRAGEASERFGSGLHMAPAQLRRRLIAGTEQGEVWREVQETQERLGRTRGRAMRDERSGSSLGLSLDLPELQEQLWQFLEPIQGSFNGGDLRGYLAHIEGVGWHLEWFATRALFQASQARLVRALATEALGAPERARRGPELAEARRWLASAALLETTHKLQVGAAKRKQRARAGTAMSLLCWPDSQVVHGVAVGA